MDMLYARYSSPMDLMSEYISRGRFGDFIEGFLQAEKDRKKEEAERDEDQKMWLAYVYSNTDPNKSFKDWKAEVLGRAGTSAAGKKTAGSDFDLDEKGIKDIIGKLFPDG